MYNWIRAHSPDLGVLDDLNIYFKTHPFEAVSNSYTMSLTISRWIDVRLKEW